MGSNKIKTECEFEVLFLKICFLFCRRAIWPVPDSNRGTVCIRRGHTLDRNDHGSGGGYHLRYRGIHTHRPHHCDNRVLVLSTTSTTVKVIAHGVWHERECSLKNLYSKETVVCFRYLIQAICKMDKFIARTFFER